MRLPHLPLTPPDGHDSDVNDDITPLLLSSNPPSPSLDSPPVHPRHPSSSSSLVPFSPSSPSSSLLQRKAVPSFTSVGGRRLILGLLALLCFLVVFHFVLFPRIALYATTGSLLYHPYEYYASAAAARRLYPAHFTADGNYTELAKTELSMWTCPAPSNASSPMLPYTPAQQQPASADAVTHVHVVVGVTSWTLFPFFWDSILINHTWTDASLQPTPLHCTPTNDCHRCADPLSRDARCRKWFPRERLLLTLVNHPIDPSLLPGIRTLLVVGEHMEPRMMAYLQRPDVEPLLHPDLHVAALMLTGEECNGYHPDVASMRGSNPRLRFLMQTYGDCRLNPQWNVLAERSLPSSAPVDVQQSVVYWPLGPSVEHGFPSRLPALEEEGSEDEERPLLLNLMVSINQEKSTRMQAWMVTTELCAQLAEGRCYAHNNDLVWKIVSAFDRFTSLSLHDYPPFSNPTSTEYLPLLTASTFTLCPAGKNPEQYRIWEALMAGSIPIVEDVHLQDHADMHAAYGSQFRCTALDVHRVLKKYRAPVLFLDDWRELPQLIASMGEQEVRAKRRELREWFRELKAELRRELFDRVKWLNGAVG